MQDDQAVTFPRTDRPVSIVFLIFPPTYPPPSHSPRYALFLISPDLFEFALLVFARSSSSCSLHLLLTLLAPFVARSHSATMSDLAWALVSAKRHKGSFDLVASHVLIDHVLDFVCAPADPWTTVDRLHIDRKDLLGLIPKLACVSKEWNAAIRSRVEYAALRAAPSLRRNAAAGSNWLRQRRCYPVAEFDEACAIFSKSWSFSRPLPMRLRTANLGDLSNSELAELLTFLRSGWWVEISVTPGDGQELLETVWVTPAHRMKHL